MNMRKNPQMIPAISHQLQKKISRNSTLTTTDVDNNTNSSSPVQKTPSFLTVLKSAFDFGLFKNVNYVIYIISSFFLYMSYYVPYLYIPDRALHHDISKDHSSLLITIAGIASCVARTLSGFIADLKIVRSRRYLCYSTTLILCSVTFLFHFEHDFTSYAANAAVYGALTGQYHHINKANDKMSLPTAPTQPALEQQTQRTVAYFIHRCLSKAFRPHTD